MTPEAQRIAIAEACGWKYKGSPGFADVHYRAWIDPFGKSQFNCPDYLNDLNAMHEAEKALTEAQFLRYKECLAVLCCKQNGFKNFSFVATAAQRAEAFLRTLNLWKQ